MKKGFKHSKKTRLKMSLSRKGIKLSDETRRRMSESKEFTVLPKGHKMNISKALKAYKEKQSPKYEYKGKSLSLKNWSKELGIPYQTLYSRLFLYKYSIKNTLTK